MTVPAGWLIDRSLRRSTARETERDDVGDGQQDHAARKNFEHG